MNVVLLSRPVTRKRGQAWINLVGCHSKTSLPILVHRYYHLALNRQLLLIQTSTTNISNFGIESLLIGYPQIEIQDVYDIVININHTYIPESSKHCDRDQHIHNHHVTISNTG